MQCSASVAHLRSSVVVVWLEQAHTSSVVVVRRLITLCFILR